jgi:hypothetical protein
LLVVLELQKLAEFIDPDWGDKVNSGIGLSYRPAILHGLAGGPVPVRQLYVGVDFIPQSWIYEFGSYSTNFILFQVSVCGEGSTSEEEKINEIQDEIKETKVQDKDQEMERVKEENKMEEIKEKDMEEKIR